MKSEWYACMKSEWRKTIAERSDCLRGLIAMSVIHQAARLTFSNSYSPPKSGVACEKVNGFVEKLIPAL